MTDNNIFDLMREKLYTGLVCDVLDELGYREQAMHERLRPLDPESIIAGRAKTILAVDVYHEGPEPYKMEMEALDSIEKDEVPVVCTNQSPNNGVWGELLSTATKMRGGVGAVVDGMIRDTKGIRRLGFPVFSAGYRPLDSRGRGLVIDYDCPIVAGGVKVLPGDVVFADFDGVVTIPKAIFEQVIDQALEKCEKENRTRDELLQGYLLQHVYAKYGVL